MKKALLLVSTLTTRHQIFLLFVELCIAVAMRVAGCNACTAVAMLGLYNSTLRQHLMLNIRLHRVLVHLCLDTLIFWGNIFHKIEGSVWNAHSSAINIFSSPCFTNESSLYPSTSGQPILVTSRRRCVPSGVQLDRLCVPSHPVVRSDDVITVSTATTGVQLDRLVFHATLFSAYGVIKSSLYYNDWCIVGSILCSRAPLSFEVKELWRQLFAALSCFDPHASDTHWDTWYSHSFLHCIHSPHLTLLKQAMHTLAWLFIWTKLFYKTFKFREISFSSLLGLPTLWSLKILKVIAG